MLNKIIRACILGLVFLLPLFFLPFSVEAFEFNKMFLLILLTSIGILAWVGKMVFQEKQVKIKFSLFDPFLILFLLAIVVSAIFSVDPRASWFGVYGRFWPSALGFVFLGLFYFLFTNNVAIGSHGGNSNSGTGNDGKGSGKTKKSSVQLTSLSAVLKTFIVSCLLVSVSAYLAIFGLWEKINQLVKGKLPDVMQIKTFSFLGGALEALALFLVCAVVLLLSLIALRDKKGLLATSDKKGSFGFIMYVLLFLNLGLLVLINFQPAWITLIISLILFLALSFWKRIFKENVNRLGLPIFFVLIALVFVLFNPLRQIMPEGFAFSDLPSEMLLNQKASWGLALSGVKENPVLGAGSGAFFAVFAKHKPAGLMQSDFWQLRFDRSGTAITEFIATNGILGLLVFLAMIGMFGLICYLFIAAVQAKGFSKKFAGKLDETAQEREERKILVLPFFSLFAALIVAQFFYYQTIILAFLLFLAMGLAVVSWANRKEKKFNFKDFPEVGLVFSILFWVLSACSLFGYFSLGKIYLADVYFRNYLNNGLVDLPQLEKAGRLNPKEPMYQTALAGAYLSSFRIEASETEPDAQKAANLVALAVKSAKAAVEIAPNRAQVLETAAIVYRDIQGAANGAEDWAIKNFEDLLKIEPQNPVALSELGKVYLRKGETDKAKEYFLKAVEVKENFVEGQILLAQLENEEGNKDAGMQRLEGLVGRAPFSVEARFELGRLYYNEQEYSKAKDQFEAAVTLYPTHSNSLYSLALTYEKLGLNEQAVIVLERVLDLNPGNDEVEKTLNRVEANENENSEIPEESEE